MNKRLLTLLSFLVLCTGIFAQNLDSLYACFEQDRSSYRSIANAIRVAMGDTLSCEDESYEQARVSLLKSFINYYGERENYRRRIIYLEKAVNCFEADKDSMNLAGCLHSVGATYQTLGNLDKAIEAYNRSGEILKAIDGDKSQMRYRYTLNNIAAIYQEQGKLEMAESLYKECLRLLNGMESDTHNALDRSCYLGNLCQLSSRKAKRETTLNKDREAWLKEARAYGEEALKLCIDNDGGPKDLAQRKMALATAYMLSGDLNRSESLVKDVLQISDANNLEHLKVRAYSLYAQLQQERKDYGSAENYYELAIALAEEGNYHDMLLELVDDYAHMLKKSNPAKAVSLLEKKDMLKDEVYSQSQNELISEFQVKYDLLNKERALSELNAKAKQRKMLMSFLAFLLVASVLIISYVLKNLKETKRRRDELAEANKTRDKLFSIISHDLRNPVNAQRNALRGLVANGAALDSATLGLFHREMLRSSDNMVSLVENVLNWARSQSDRISPVRKSFSLSDLAKEIIESQKMISDAKGLELSSHIPEDIVADSDRNLVGIVIRNLVSNAQKFTPEGGKIAISAKEKGGKILISVKDSGMGMSAEQLRSIMGKGHVDSSAGTNGEKGSGLGIMVCKEILDKMGSTLEIESALGKGTEVSFKIDSANEG